MKSVVKAVVLFALLGSVLVLADSQPGQFQHVIIVIQENRTPDNLFGGYIGTQWQVQNGADLLVAPDAQPWCLGACFDPGHANSDWQHQYSHGKPACQSYLGSCGKAPPSTFFTTCNGHPVCNGPNGQGTWVGCTKPNPIYLQESCGAPQPVSPEDSYVSLSYDPSYSINPYFSIASQYGFANYFFQTNQGNSQPAHDFLFGGTSAPYGVTTQPTYNYFAAGNPTGGLGQGSGCIATPDPEDPQVVAMLDQYGNPATPEPPCFDHYTLVDLLGPAGLSWKYYTGDIGKIWTAPTGIKNLCVAVQQPDGTMKCTGPDFTGTPPYTPPNVVTPQTAFFLDVDLGGTNIVPLPGQHQTPICHLPNVAWIVPDGRFSDHPGLNTANRDSTDIEGGPNWVARIVNAIGGAGCVEPPGPFQGQPPWSDTVIFVVWDDWGGWYDHIMDYDWNGNHIGELYEPQDPQLNLGLNCVLEYTYNGNPYPWGCGYTYGFRVPFLVVSAYTKPGTVSGACTPGVDCCAPNQTGTACAHNVDPHRHDFGSILAFIEWNFNLTLGGINLSNNFPFADYYAPELQYDRNQGANAAPLGDFFGSTYYGFSQIATPNNPFTLDYFLNFNGPFTDPDNDMIDND